jgi:hypothetical protein
MKNIQKYLVFVALFAAFSACIEDSIDPLTGKYTAPAEYLLTSLASQSAVKHDDGTRSISLQLVADDAALNVDFVVNAHFLRENVYTLAPVETAKNGNYTSAVFNAIAITAGAIYVRLTDENFYSISGTLQLVDNSFIRVSFEGEIIFPEDPPTMTYSLEVQKPYAWTLDGVTWNTVEGSQLNKITLKSDGAVVAYLEIVTEENAVSLAGTYPVQTATSPERAIVQGQFMNLLWLGMFDMPIESGSYLVDLVNGDKLFIRDGSLTLADDNGVLSFASSALAIQDVSTEMAFGVLPASASLDYRDATLEITYSYTNEVIAPYSYTLDGVTYIEVEGSQLNKITILADGTPCAAFETVTETSPATLTGEYPVKVVNTLERAIVQGQFMNLLWLGMFDMPIESGSYYVENNEKRFIREGNITITEQDGALSITGNGLKLQDVSTEMAFGVLPDDGSVNFLNIQMLQ